MIVNPITFFISRNQIMVLGENRDRVEGWLLNSVLPVLIILW